MNVTIKRILAALGAAFISVSLGLPASAVQVNEDPDREFFGQYYDEGDPSTIYWVGHELLGDSFWAKSWIIGERVEGNPIWWVMGKGTPADSEWRIWSV